MNERQDEFRHLRLEQRMYFDRCMDFLARMMEKYGGELELPPQKTGITDTQSDDKRADAA